MCMIQIYKCWHTKYAIMKEKNYKAIRKNSQMNMKMGKGMNGKNSFKKDKMNIRWNEDEDETDIIQTQQKQWGQSDQELYIINMQEIISNST